MKSKYPSSKPCLSCKAEWNIGDEIYHINDKYWCSNAKCPEPMTLSEAMQKPAEALEKYAKPLPPPQAKDFDEMQFKSLFDEGFTRAKRKKALLDGIKKALPNLPDPVHGMIFKEICADLRL